MDVVLVLLVAYVLAGSIWPQIIRNRPVFVLGSAVVALAIVLPFVTRILEAAAFAILVIGPYGGNPDDWRRLFFRFRSSLRS